MTQQIQDEYHVVTPDVMIGRGWPENQHLKTRNCSVEPDTSLHHLFTRPEIRAKLVEIFGEPKTMQEQVQLDAEVEKCHGKIPKYRINHNLHKRIHGH